MMVDKDNEKKKCEKKIETNDQEKIDKAEAENQEEHKKPKINVLSNEETKDYFNEAVKNENIEAFLKEFKRNRFKKKQPDGIVWNEVTKKFEKSQHILEIEKEIEMLEKDKESEFKNFHAKNLNRDLSERIKRNPEKAKEILIEHAVRKLDPKEALKDLNKDLYKDLLDTCTTTPSEGKDRNQKERKAESSKKNKHFNQENSHKNNYNDNLRDIKFQKDDRRKRDDKNQKYNKDFSRRSEDSPKSYNRKNSFDQYSGYKNVNSITYRDKTSPHDRSKNREKSKEKTYLCRENDRHYSKYKNSDMYSNHYNRNNDYCHKRSKSTNCIRDFSELKNRNSRDKEKSFHYRDRSQDQQENKLNKSLLSDISISNGDKNYRKETNKTKKDVPYMEINIATPENNYYSNHIDLTDDDVICYIPAENENQKRKKMHQEMKDLVVNVKGKKSF